MVKSKAKFCTKLNQVKGITTLLCALSIYVTHIPAKAGTVYKYKQGEVTTYQDAPLLSAKDDAHSVLNNQGRTLQVIPNKEERLRQVASNRAKLRANRNDKALLATFSTEQDLLRARDDRLGIINGYIDRLDERVGVLNSKLSVLDNRIAEQEKGSGKARQDLYKQRNRTLDDIESTWDLIDTKSLERKTVHTKFKMDLSRYRYLKNKRNYN